MKKTYTDKQLLDRVKSLSTFKEIPKDYWILGIQSKDDEFDRFDDKFYLFKGETFIMVTTGTTNAGSYGHLKFDKYNPEGYASIKTNEWYYGLWKYGLHKQKMEALRQVKPIKYYRDGDRDKKTEEVGILREGIIYANFHTVSYVHKKGYMLNQIGGWSLACQVANRVDDYYKLLNYVKKQESVTYCLIKEF